MPDFARGWWVFTVLNASAVLILAFLWTILPLPPLDWVFLAVFCPLAGVVQTGFMWLLGYGDPLEAEE